MNIFATSYCPKQSAQWMCNLRSNKMFLESVQMLSTHIHKISPETHQELNLYKPTHKNHPCTLWLEKNPNNIQWLMEHCEHLSSRLNPTHKTNIPFTKLKKLYNFKLGYTDFKYLDFENCTTFKHIDDTVKAYKFFMCEKWINDKRPPTWTQPNSIKPDWYLSSEIGGS